jgi:hypothetical protein
MGVLSTAAAQEAAVAERPPPGHLRVLTVPQTAAPPKIDGIIDDEAWRGAAIAERFWISEQERWPTEQTQVLVTADRDSLYFAFKVYESRPDEIEALQTRRDAGLGLDDQVGVELDPFLSYREISTYSVNAAGTQSDAIAGGRARQLAWKGDWRAATTRTPYGWSAEIAIPFAILNFETGVTAFGVNFLRYHHRTTEWSRWADVTVRSLPEERGRLTTLAPVRSAQTQPLTFLPYILVGHNVLDKRGHVREAFATAGADIRYQPQPNLTGVLSLNPDFSQVETAVTDINFNYNEKYRSDNRPFFQEGSAYFGDRRDYFYSNRVPAFDFGGKLFTRTEGYQLGGLATRAPDQRTDAVLRVQRELDPRHTLGGIVVGTDRPDFRNMLFAAHGRGREVSGFNYTVDGAVTSTNGRAGDGSFVQGSVGFERNFWSVGLSGNRYSVDYFPADALLAQDLPDTQGAGSYASYYRDFGTGAIRVVTADVGWQRRDTGDGRLQRSLGTVGATVELREEVRLSVAVNGGPYRPVGAVPGAWSDVVNHDRYWSGGLDFNTRSSRLSYGAFYASGFLAGGDYDYALVYGWARPTSTTFVTLNGERLSYFGHSDQVIITAGWDITPRHGVYGRYIWNEDSRYSRFAYTFRVARNMDFFAVYDKTPGTPPQLSAKLLMTFP